MHVSPTDIEIAVGAAIAAAYRYTPLLDRFKNRSAAEAEAELMIADRRNKRLADENRELRDAKVQLEREALTPILEIIKSVADTLERVASTCDQTFERLASFNGSLSHIEEGLATATQGLQAVTGTICELHGIPLKPPPRT